MAVLPTSSIEIEGGGPETTGDPLEFVLAATGRRIPSAIGLDVAIDVYADIPRRVEHA
jgi:hypothetical protein